MKLNNIIGTLTLSVSLSVGFGASAEEDWMPKDMKVPLDQLTIGFATLGSNVNGYVAQYMVTYEEYARELGVKTITLDPQADPARQADQIKDLIAQKVDVMLVWPVNSVAVVPSLQAVHDAGIPIVVTDSPVDESAKDLIATFTGADQLAQARAAAEAMCTALGNKGNVVMINGLPGYILAQQREEGFKTVLAEKCPEVKILDSQPANWSREKAQSVMENYIVRFGDQIDGVYSADSDMGIGALAAVQAAEAEGTIPAGHIKFTDCTLFGAAYDAIKAGTYTASVFQSPIVEAKEAIKYAILAAQGIKLDPVYYFAAPVVTKDNIDQFERPTW